MLPINIGPDPETVPIRFAPAPLLLWMTSSFASNVPLVTEPVIVETDPTGAAVGVKTAPLVCPTHVSVPSAAPVIGPMVIGPVPVTVPIRFALAPVLVCITSSPATNVPLATEPVTVAQGSGCSTTCHAVCNRPVVSTPIATSTSDESSIKVAGRFHT